MKVESQLGVEMKVLARPGAWGQHNAFNQQVIQEVMSDSAEYDFISWYAYCMPVIVQEGVLANLLELPNIDLSKPWWHQKFIEASSAYGKLYSVAGDIDLTTISFRSTLFFNKRLTEEYIPDEDLYGKVLDGSFTQDYFISIAKDIYTDLDGDQKKSDGDIFGVDLNNALDSFPVGGNFTYTKKTDDGGFEWNLYNEHNHMIVERFFDFYNANNGAYFVNKIDHSRFIEGRVVFYPEYLSLTEKLRDMKDEYGILPMPKYDEAQGKYCSIAADKFSLIGVPTTVKEPELVGAFLELMCEYSYKIVTPRYYEIAMKGKYLRDDESCQMFDIIVDGAWYDFANTNSSALSDPVTLTRMALSHYQNKNLASRWAGEKEKLTNLLSDLLQRYKES